MRPTADRVKESLFAALGDARVADAIVLDLYAGSGALAIEALSRGAARAVLVEQSAAAVAVIRANLDAAGFTVHARVVAAPVAAVLQRPRPAEAPFDLAFLDPPYAMPAGELGAALAALDAGGWLAPGAAVVWEGRTGGDRPPVPPRWEVTWERAYGDTLVTVATVPR